MQKRRSDPTSDRPNSTISSSIRLPLPTKAVRQAGDSHNV